jgi:maltooligosyltrehalose trehalohydrolase
VGNRALGERLIQLVDEKVLRAAVALQLLCPQIPLLFMGEEIGVREPFLYFTDHQDPALAKAVSEGRAAEFSKFPEFSSGKLKVPDPNALETFRQSQFGEADHEWSEFYQALLALRHHLIIPHLKGCKAIDSCIVGDKAVIASWRLGDGSTLTIASNFSDTAVRASLPRIAPFFGESEGEGDDLAPATTLVWIEEA